METLTFSQLPETTVATNRFIDVPIILQYEHLPLIRVVQATAAGFETEIPVYHNDGTYLAKAVGS